MKVHLKLVGLATAAAMFSILGSIPGAAADINASQTLLAGPACSPLAKVSSHSAPLPSTFTGSIANNGSTGCAMARIDLEYFVGTSTALQRKTSLVVNWSASPSTIRSVTASSSASAISPQKAIFRIVAKSGECSKYTYNVSLARFSGNDLACESTRVAAAGDIACSSSAVIGPSPEGSINVCEQGTTAQMIKDDTAIKAVFALGDLQYENGSLPEFNARYAPSWGQFKSKTYPVVGNHEYMTAGAAGYFDYFGTRAGDRSKGYYSFNVGWWHVVVLNSNCTKISGGCAAGGAQEQWLRADLAANRNKCVAALYHHPLKSSGSHGNNDGTVTVNQNVAPLWTALHEKGADLVLNGHDHDYERFAPLDASGMPASSASTGMTEIVAGLGGAELYGFRQVPQPGSAFRYVDPKDPARLSPDSGVLKVGLKASSYSWSFVNTSGTVIDSGARNCR